MSPPPFRDTREIAVEDLSEIDYWVKYLGTTRDELLAAISAVGPSAREVKAFLDEKASRAG